MPASNTYSKEDLATFREVIHAKLDEVKSQMDLIQNQLDGVNKHIEQVNVSYGDDSRRNQQRSLLNGRLVRQKRMVRDLERALLRIENGSYGICTETGELISKKRLMAMPTATLSVQAKERMNS
jgi:DnaK suppressor protein